MLAKDNRLRKEADIKRVFSKGKRANGALVGLRYRSNGMDASRFAVVVGTKVSKRAVDRNRLRRRVRATIRELKDEVHGGYDVAVILRPAAREASFPTLREDVIAALKKTPLLS